MNSKAMRSHRSRCVFCNKCFKYVELRHLDKCVGRKTKGEQFLCSICRRVLSKKNQARHIRRHEKSGVVPGRLEVFPKSTYEVRSRRKSCQVGRKKVSFGIVS